MPYSPEDEAREAAHGIGSCGFVLKDFDNWLAQVGFAIPKEITLAQYKGIFSRFGESGWVSLWGETLGGVVKVAVAVYTPRGNEFRPERIGDAFRLSSRASLKDDPPWPGARILAAGGETITGARLPEQERSQAVQLARAFANKPVDERVRCVIAAVVGIPDDEIMPDTVIDEQMMWDADAGVISFELEDVFGIRIPSTDVERFRTVGDVIMFMRRELA